MSDNPQFEAAKKSFASAEKKFNDLSSRARLNSVSNEVSSLATVVAKMPADIAEIRKRSYAFRSYLEHKAEVFAEHWADIRQRVEITLDTEANALTRLYDDIKLSLERVKRSESNPDRYIDAVKDFEGRVNQLETDISATTKRLTDMYSTLKRDVDDTTQQINEINWICDQRDEASFQFLAGENIFLAARSEWRKTGRAKDDPDGILFLTDQRLIFEQKETVGKTLGMFGGKKVQSVAWEVPLHLIEDFGDEKKGFFGGRDIVHFIMGSGASHPKISVEVKGRTTNKFWIAQIQRMMKGEANDERAIPPDEELLSTIRNAPTQCHVCGGTLPMLTAGQMQIECAYCGTVIRL